MDNLKTKIVLIATSTVIFLAAVVSCGVQLPYVIPPEKQQAAKVQPPPPAPAAPVASAKPAEPVFQAPAAGIGAPKLEIQRAPRVEERLASSTKPATKPKQTTRMARAKPKNGSNNVVMAKAEVPATATYDPSLIAEDILKQLFTASMAFNVPKSVNYFDTFEIELVIDPSKKPGDIVISEEGRVTRVQIVVSKIVSAKLIAEGFDVASASPEKQPLVDGPTTWKWMLTPKAEGPHKLIVSIFANIKVDDQNLDRLIKTFEQEITVQVTVPQRTMMFFRNNWQWLWSVILLPVALWSWRYLKNKRDAIKPIGIIEPMKVKE